MSFAPVSGGVHDDLGYFEGGGEEFDVAVSDIDWGASVKRLGFSQRNITREVVPVRRQLR